MFHRKSTKYKQNLLTEFGHLKDDFFDFEQIEKYFRKKDNSNSFQILSDKTCNDLDINELFMFIDRTKSKVGQQFLYNKIRNIPADNSESEKKETFINEFISKPDLIVEAQYQLSLLNNKEAYYIASLFQEEILKPPKWYALIPLLLFTNVFFVVVTFFKPAFLLGILGVTIINLIIHFWNKKNLFNYYSSIPQLSKLNGVAQELFKIDFLKALKPDLMKSTRILNKVNSRMSFFNFDVGMQNDQRIVFWSLLEIVKIIFLIEPLFLFGTLKRIDTKRKEIEDVFLYVGEIDAIISIASLRNGLEIFCKPEITNKQEELLIKEVYHPLIENCITNSLNLNNKSILLTGSNMSGKTTFIRTVAINLITGLTINTCFAEKIVTPRLKIFSAIRISDDLMNDKSYYFEEVLTIKEMIDISNDGAINLFLLDEIFKGTNTVERISAGKAVLSYLNGSKNIVFVSTHDIELAELLINEYDLYHFSEIISQNTVDFDFKLKAGKLKTRNAIRILQINSYPDSVIKEAMDITKKIDETDKH